MHEDHDHAGGTTHQSRLGACTPVCALVGDRTTVLGITPRPTHTREDLNSMPGVFYWETRGASAGCRASEFYGEKTRGMRAEKWGYN